MWTYSLPKQARKRCKTRSFTIHGKLHTEAETLYRGAKQAENYLYV
jgi:hypothetical protein